MMDIEKTRSLEKSDVGHGEKRMYPAYLYKKYEQYISKVKKRTKMNYLISFAKTSGLPRFCWGYVLFLTAELISYIPTQILNVLVSDLETEYLSILFVISFFVFRLTISFSTKMDVYHLSAGPPIHFRLCYILG